MGLHVINGHLFMNPALLCQILKQNTKHYTGWSQPLLLLVQNETLHTDKREGTAVDWQCCLRLWVIRKPRLYPNPLMVLIKGKHTHQASSYYFSLISFKKNASKYFNTPPWLSLCLVSQNECIFLQCYVTVGIGTCLRNTEMNNMMDLAQQKKKKKTYIFL